LRKLTFAFTDTDFLVLAKRFCFHIFGIISNVAAHTSCDYLSSWSLPAV